MPTFIEMLRAKFDEGKFVCVGLDSDIRKLPREHLGRFPSFTDEPPGGHSLESEAVFWFNKAIIEATKNIVCAYKPNMAFYERLGYQGMMALAETIAYIHTIAPEMPVILDGKRGDIGNTNDGYVAMAFSSAVLTANAITVPPYMGGESLQPFLDCGDKGIIVLCRTSNPGAGEFQDLMVKPSDGLRKLLTDDPLWDPSWPTEVPLYQQVAHNVATNWNTNGNCCLVVGATAPAELAMVRKIVGDMPILIPGVGAQGGDLEATVRAGVDSSGQGMIINSSRGLIFASSGAGFAEAARAATLQMHEEITAVLATV